MKRSALSRPLALALSDGLISSDTTVFDYGCGRGDDLRQLGLLDIQANGWDPAHLPEAPRTHADIVNLGYVVNVIERLTERESALREAWRLTRDVLVVSARMKWEAVGIDGTPYRDGVLTSTNTFQKFYDHDELREWIAGALGTRPYAAAPGIFYVFRNEQSAQRLRARQSRTSSDGRSIAELVYVKNRPALLSLEQFAEENRRLPTPVELPNSAELIDAFGSIRAAFSVIRRGTDAGRWVGVDAGSTRKSEKRFEQNLEVLQPLIDFISDRGRLPRSGELATGHERQIETEFGSIRAAYSLIRRVAGDDRWTAYAERAKADFLVYLALSAFGGRPRYSELSEDLQYDVRDFFGSYKAAGKAGDELLFGVGDSNAVSDACAASSIGKLTPEALYVHESVIPKLSPLLRVYEGCARVLTGSVLDGVVIKLNRLKPQVSYLLYPDFDRDPHPAVQGTVISRLSKLYVSYRDYSSSDNPSILHRKELLVDGSYPHRAKFERLTRQEQQAGLLSQPHIGRYSEWQAVLEQANLTLHGHQLRRRQESC